MDRHCLCNHAETLHGHSDVEGTPCTECSCKVFEHDPLYEPPGLDVQIDHLHETRERIATLGQELAERELGARVLRLTIETELRQGGMAATQAERQAKADDRYLAHERKTIRMGFDHAVAFADAEAERFDIELQLTLLQREPVSA
jgi:hypothetical protein